MARPLVSGHARRTSSVSGLVLFAACFKASKADPSNALSLQEMQRTSEMIDRNKKGNVKGDELNLTPTEVARKADGF